MSTVTKPLVAVTLSRSGEKIVIRGPKNEQATGFYQTLPASRWDSGAMAWVVESSPSVAWRLVNESPLPIEADDQVLSMATKFSESLSTCRWGQPEKRKTDGWGHQVKAFNFADPKAGAMLAMGMGTGKSKVAVDLIVNKKAQRTIIVCPVSVLSVWRREFEKHSPIPLEILILDKGTVAKKTATAALFLERCKRLRLPCVIAINYESSWRPAFCKWSLGQEWDIAILDESHRVKGHSTQVSKFVSQLGRISRFRLCLTGTPMPHSPLDLFGQFRFLDRGIYGTWFHHFRNRYAKLNPIFPGKVDAWLNQDELKKKFSLLAYRVTADEVLDLPPAMHHERRCRLSPSADAIYHKIEKELIADVGCGVVTATNALTRLLRLQQATSGYSVEDETKQEVEIDTEKRDTLVELLEDIGPEEPCVVFCRFRYDLHTVREAAEKLGRRYGELSGMSKDGLDSMGCMTEGVQILGVQIQSGGVGVDLTRARYAVYFSLGFSLGDYEQSLARVHRPGQTRPTHYYHLIASGTVDDVVYRALKARKEVVEAVLEALKNDLQPRREASDEAVDQ